MLAEDGVTLSSRELQRTLGVTQKTAWFMQYRIRLAMQSPVFKAADTARPRSGEIRECLARLLRVSKAELDRRVQEAKLNSDRIYMANAPGRKRKAS
jgi:hypothetical protein